MKVIIGKYPGSKSNKERKVDVRIDTWDTWNADETLALIIAPLLKQLREINHGTPFTDEEDAPEEFKGEDEDHSEDEYRPAGYNQARWEWILDEMIWAFTQKIDNSEEDVFYHNRDQLNMKFEKIKGTTYSKLKIDYQKDPEKAPYNIDHEGLTTYRERIDNGFRLFGKYYNSLWD